MNRTGRAIAIAFAIVAAALHSTPAASGKLERAAGHPMRYHLSLPKGWTNTRTWPVVVVIPDAARDFDANLERFAAVRGERPYVLVAPEVMTCGGARTRTRDLYAYSAAEWDSIARMGDDFAFDDAGLGAILADVQKRFAGEPKAFLSGWEAGGHTVWAQAFRRPERWRAVAPVTPNYQRRGLTDSNWSRAPERTALPIQTFRCGTPTGDAAIAVQSVDQQTAQAFADAKAHGFAPMPVRVIEGSAHGPLPGPVLDWFDSIRKR